MEGKTPGITPRLWRRAALFFGVLAVSLLAYAPAALAVTEGGSKASLVIPDLGDVSFHGISGQLLLTLGLIICALGIAFGMLAF